MQKRLPPEHDRELLRHPAEHLLDGRGVPHERRRHGQPSRWDVTDAWLHIVWYPLNKVRGVLVLHIDHLLINLFSTHLPPEHRWGGQVPAVSRVSRTHHVLRIPHLLCQLRDGEGPVLLWSTRRQGCKTHHEEVQSREWDKIDRQFSEVGVELAGEAEAACYAAHGGGDQMVQIPNCKFISY